MKSKIKILKYAMPILFFMIWFAYGYYDLNIKYSKPVDYSNEAIIINTSDKSYMSKARVTLKGNWKRNGYLFLESYLDVEFEDPRFSDFQKPSYLAISYEKKYNRVHIMNLENGNYISGKGFGDRSLKKLILNINDSNGINSSYYLISPATNIEEARSIINSVVQAKDKVTFDQ